MKVPSKHVTTYFAFSSSMQHEEEVFLTDGCDLGQICSFGLRGLCANCSQ
jgi:hypothetical protein